MSQVSSAPFEPRERSTLALSLIGRGPRPFTRLWDIPSELVACASKISWTGTQLFVQFPEIYPPRIQARWDALRRNRSGFQEPAHEFARFCGGYPRGWPVSYRQHKAAFHAATYYQTIADGALQCNFLPFQKAFRKRLAYARFMFSTWETLRLSSARSGLLVSMERQRRMVEDIFCYPEAFAYNLKEGYAAVRGKVFGQLDSQFIGNWKRLSDRQLLLMSTNGRALPAPLRSSGAVETYVERQTKPLDTDITRFKAWVEGWVDAHFPREVKTSLQLTGHGCVEFTRSQGGIPRAIAQVIAYQQHVERIRPPDHSFGSDYVFPLGTHLVQPHLAGQVLARWELLLAGSVNILRKMTNFPPAIPVSAPERGLKERVPTKSIVPVIVIAGMLRSLVQPLLESDPRIAPSITPGDPLRHQIGRAGVIWRSLDLTTATDNHSFEMTRCLYDAVLRRCPRHLQFLKEFIPIIVGPRILVRKEYPIPAFGRTPEGRIGPFFPHERDPQFYGIGVERARFPPDDKPRLTPYKGPIRFVSGGMLGQTDPELNAPGKPYLTYSFSSESPPSTSIIWELPEWYSSFTGPVTQRGPMMGDATSWPLLPLVNIFTWEMATGRPADVRTTGDDAMASCSHEESDRWTAELIALDAVPSKTKDFTHHKYGLYTELFFEWGILMPLLPNSLLIGAPGGSKGEANWYDAPGSLVSAADRVGLPRERIPFQLASYTTSWSAAARQGIPVHFPPGYGGIGLPERKAYHLRNRLGRPGWAQWGSLVSGHSPFSLRGPLHLALPPRFTPTLSEALIQATKGDNPLRVNPGYRGSPLEKDILESLANMERVELAQLLSRLGSTTFIGWQSHGQRAAQPAILESEYRIENGFIPDHLKFIKLSELFMRYFQIPAALIKFLDGNSLRESLRTPCVSSLAAKLRARLRKVKQRLKPVKSATALMLRKDAEVPNVVVGGPIGQTLLGSTSPSDYSPALLGVDYTYSVAL